MSSEAKRASNSRYLSKFKTVSVRLLPEDLERIAGAAAEGGESVPAYLIRAGLELGGGGRAAGGASDLLTPAAVQIATAAADAAGLPVPEWIERAVMGQQAADQRAEELRRLLANKE